MNIKKLKELIIMRTYINKPTYSDKSEFPPLKKEALIVALIKGNVSKRQRVLNYE